MVSSPFDYPPPFGLPMYLMSGGGGDEVPADSGGAPYASIGDMLGFGSMYACPACGEDLAPPDPVCPSCGEVTSGNFT